MKIVIIYINYFINTKNDENNNNKIAQNINNETSQKNKAIQRNNLNNCLLVQNATPLINNVFKKLVLDS